MESLELNAPSAVTEIARRLEERGFETWAVGGAVRDAVLGLPAEDWDLATSARPDDVRRIFRRTVPIGIEHGTIGVLGRDGILYEVTTFRRDVETFGRHAIVEFADSVEEDLARRDFTMNALAWHPLRAELKDPFDGLADLQQRQLRTVGVAAERFAEDYLRVLRALRFAGHFRLAIESHTWNALVQAAPQLTRLSAERIREELFKILSKTRTASAALSLYAASGALAVLFPELDATVGLEETSESQRDLWTETLLAVDSIPTTRPLLRLAVLLHGSGKPAARSRDLRGGWRFTGHEVLAGRLADTIMRRLKASNADIERVTRLVAGQEALFPPDAPGAGIRRWLRHIGPDLVNDLFRLRIALCRARGGTGGDGRDIVERWHLAHYVMLSKPPLAIADLAIGGGDLSELGLEPGPQFGEILRALLERVSDDPALNTREQLLAIVSSELLS